MAKWFISAKKADFDEIGRKFSISPILARLIRNRDITSDEDIRKYLYGTVDEMYDPYLLKGMKETVNILATKLSESASIRIIGDYDADGIAAATILLKGLNNLGGNVDAVIPHRVKDGYGLNENLVTEAKEAGIDTIITCDNGISAVEQIKLAKEMGMTVIITDHHEVSFEIDETGLRLYHLPPADAIVDPWQVDCPYPYKQICGAMVALKVIEALFDHLGKPIPEVLHEELRCLAAIATVCDVMELCDENRILVKYALKHLHKCENVGLRALFEVTGVGNRPDGTLSRNISPYHIGFIIGPNLNATGRLDTAARALELLKTTDYREAVNIAGELKSLNESRKEMTQQGVEAAIAMVEEMSQECEAFLPTGALARQFYRMDSVLVLYMPDIHESIAGIIAGRVRERYHRPTFILTLSEGEVKGSGRSIETYHMYDEMCKCRELFTKFGGHKQAAGFSMPVENIDKFRISLNQNSTLGADDFVEKVNIDIAMPLSYITPCLIDELNLLEPFGIANPKPVFAQKDITFLKGWVMGKSGRAARYKVCDVEGKKHDILYFGDIEAFDRFLCEKFSPEVKDDVYRGFSLKQNPPAVINITYYPDMVTYNGKEDIRIVMQHYT